MFNWSNIGNDIYNGVKGVWNDITGQTTALQTAAETNATNKSISDENIALTREWNEYQKALQQEIFEREDTAYQRTAKDMMAAGLNPLSMQGTNSAGQAVLTQAPQHTYQAQQASTAIDTISGLVNGISSIVGEINALKTGKLQRDQLQTQIDHQRLINDMLERENKHKVDIGQYDTDMLPEKLITHLLDWTQNGRAGKLMDFQLNDLLNLFNSESKTGIPIIDDLKDLLLNDSETKISIPSISNSNQSTFEKIDERDSKTKTKAYLKSFNTKNKQHYKEKNDEYTKRYGGK